MPLPVLSRPVDHQFDAVHRLHGVCDNRPNAHEGKEEGDLDMVNRLDLDPAGNTLVSCD